MAIAVFFLLLVFVLPLCMLWDHYYNRHKAIQRHNDFPHVFPYPDKKKSKISEQDMEKYKEIALAECKARQKIVDTINGILEEKYIDIGDYALKGTGTVTRKGKTIPIGTHIIYEVINYDGDEAIIKNVVNGVEYKINPRSVYKCTRAGTPLYSWFEWNEKRKERITEYLTSIGEEPKSVVDWHNKVAYYVPSKVNSHGMVMFK